MKDNDRSRTVWMGILIPLACAAFGLYRIVYPHEYNRGTAQFYEGDAVVGLGINALGIAVVVHALGFVPYQRIPAVKYMVAATGIVLFVYGLIMSLRGQA